MKQINKDKIRKILVIRTDKCLGDVLLNIPAIRALKQSFNARIVMLVYPSVKELLAGMPVIDEFLLYDEREPTKSISARLKLLRQLRQTRADLAVILNPTKRFHVLTYLAGIPRRLGYDRKWGFLLTHKIEDRKFLGQKHEIEYNLDLVRSVGADTPDKEISITVNQQDRQFVKDLMKKHELKDEDLIIAVHPYSTAPAKCWPGENFASVVDQLVLRFSAKVVVIGGRQQRSSAKGLVSSVKSQLINFCGELTLKQLAVFLQHCALLISNDSGPVHIAAAMHIPTVVIFGRNIPAAGPRRWGPWGNGHIVLHKDLGCNPCLETKCSYNFKCLMAIRPEEVLKAVKQCLAQRRCES